MKGYTSDGGSAQKPISCITLGWENLYKEANTRVYIHAVYKLTV